MKRTILHSGNIFIKKNTFASAMVIEGSHIIYVGDDNKAFSYMEEDSEIIDLLFRTVVPGFNDSHLHLYYTGVALQSVDCYQAVSIAEIIQRGKSFLQDHPHLTYIWGRGWNQDYFTDEQRLLTKDDLDQISTEVPIVFSRACGHVSSCNSAALTLLNLTEDTFAEGGVIGKDSQGVFNGIFYENAIQLLESLKPELTIDSVIDTLEFVSKKANEMGITSVGTNDLIIGSEDTSIIEQAYIEWAQKNPTVRVNHQVRFLTPQLLSQRIQEGYSPFSNDFLSYGPVKLFVDGSLGARTALLSQPYHDDPTTQGVECLSREQLAEFANIAHNNHIQLAIHAIGDLANQYVLDTYKLLDNPYNSARHGIIHSQITSQEQLDQYLKLQILSYAQPIFLHYDLHMVEDRVGKELASTSYAFNTLANLHGRLSFGSDAPVEPFNVIDGIHCAVNRQDKDYFPEGGWNPKQKVDLATAIEAFTYGGAIATFEEKKKGRLAPGYLADFVILSDDIFSMKPSEIRSVSIDKTMVNGVFVFEQ